MNAASDSPAVARGESPASRFEKVRRLSEALCAALDPEDCVAQSMPDASPAKWHLAHTTWFFETFILKAYRPDYEVYHPGFGYLFNSYYNGVGERHARPARGLLTRPTLAEVRGYRSHVDAHMRAILEKPSEASRDAKAAIDRVIEIGLHHEQQHQELMLTDLKHLFAQNPLRPAYRPGLEKDDRPTPSLEWKTIPEGLHRIGHAGEAFSFDNERPVHRVFLEPFEIANRLVTNGEFRAFIRDGGYARAELWLDAGWARVRTDGWEKPLYWLGGPDGYSEFTLAGERDLCDAEPVSHLSFIEADAYARWAGARLPTEFEWEVACGDRPVSGNFVDSGRLHPQAASKSDVDDGDGDGDGLRQLFGDLWEWTSSSYLGYPGYRPDAGTLGEYNGKFMCDQHVLRGGSCASSRSHLRATYRNFFHAPDRWQFSGIRLAKEIA